MKDGSKETYTIKEVIFSPQYNIFWLYKQHLFIKKKLKPTNQ